MTTNNLTNFDFQILIDTSGSMGANDPRQDRHPPATRQGVRDRPRR